MAPIIFGGLALGHTLNSFKINGAIVVIFTSILYYYSSTLFKLLTLLSNKFEPLYKNSPTNLFYTNLNKYLDTSNQFAYQNWIIGIILGTIFLVIGCLILVKRIQIKVEPGRKNIMLVVIIILTILLIIMSYKYLLLRYDILKITKQLDDLSNELSSNQYIRTETQTYITKK